MSSPPVISALPAVPATSDPNFETLAPALFSAIKNSFIGEVNAVASWINAGSWLTTPLAVSSGGTGASTFSSGRLLYGNGTSAIQSSSDLAFTSNYLRLGAGSAGIQFNGDTAAANALNDYEKGTFTPAIQGSTSAGSATYSVQNGFYTKIGDRVYFQAYVSWSGHTGTGNMQITGLPFASNSASNSFSPVTIYIDSAVSLNASNMLQGFVNINTAFIVLTEVALGSSNPVGAAVSAAGSLMLRGHYFV